MWRLFANSDVLYERLVHLQVLVSAEDPGTSKSPEDVKGQQWICGVPLLFAPFSY